MQVRLSSENVAELEESEDLSISVWVSFAEIYNEQIYDLLAGVTNKKERVRLKLGQSKDDIFIK